LIAFGALDRVGDSGRVVFSDISDDLLDRCRLLAGEAGVLDRCDFGRARAEDLTGIADDSVDAVTTRSVVIYASYADKQRAFDEFFRVLRPDGRLSMFEPINRFAFPEPEGRLFGFDVTPMMPLVRKVRAVFDQATGDKTLIDFDERDLVRFAERAGFAEIALHYEATVTRGGGPNCGASWSWEAFLHSAGNPHAPTLAEALDEALTPSEREELLGYLRPHFEAGDATHRGAVAYLRAVKR